MRKGIINHLFWNFGKSSVSKSKISNSLESQLWGLTTFFNPSQFKNKLKNYKYFRESSKRQGLRLVTLELAFGENEFELSMDDAEILVQLRGERRNILWQKERLLNIALMYIPSEVSKIAWLDSDIIFLNKDWVNEASKLLDDYPVVQLFKKVSLLSKDETEKCIISDSIEKPIERTYSSGLIASGYKEKTQAKLTGSPGYAWAAKKSVFMQQGFFDKTPLFNADQLMALAFCGKHTLTRSCSREFEKAYHSWSKIIAEKINRRVSCVPGEICHLWHGNRKNRFYKIGASILDQHEFNPDTDLFIDEQGLWAWGNNSVLQRRIFYYFYARNEDRNLRYELLYLMQLASSICYMISKKMNRYQMKILSFFKR